MKHSHKPDSRIFKKTSVIIKPKSVSVLHKQFYKMCQI